MPLNDEYWQTTEGMQKLDAEGLLNWQDSVGFNMSNLSLEREALLNEHPLDHPEVLRDYSEGAW